MNAGLRERFAAFWLDTMPQGVTIRPELLPDVHAVVAQDWPEGVEFPPEVFANPKAWAEFTREHPPCVTRLVTNQDGEAVPALVGPERNGPNTQESWHCGVCVSQRGWTGAPVRVNAAAGLGHAIPQPIPLAGVSCGHQFGHQSEDNWEELRRHRWA